MAMGSDQANRMAHEMVHKTAHRMPEINAEKGTPILHNPYIPSSTCSIGSLFPSSHGFNAKIPKQLEIGSVLFLFYIF